MARPATPTFDEELLLWLGDEPAGVRAADAGRIHEIASEFAMGFDRLAQIGPAVTIFGSARTPRDHPDDELVRRIGLLGRLRARARARAHALADHRIAAADLEGLHNVSDPEQTVSIVRHAHAHAHARQREQSDHQHRRRVT
jgi:hypothetical protein